MGRAPYVELHCHSAYSFLDGASLPEELAARAAELSYEALALTDHNSVSGSMELAMALAEHGPRAIHGAEVDVDVGPAGGGGPGRAGGRGLPLAGTGGDGKGGDTRHLTLLVEDGWGWRNLCRIITAAHAGTREGRTLGQARVSLETVLEHAEGLVCLTGCAERGIHDEPTARRLLAAFGPEGLRVELQRPYRRHDRARNRALAGLARGLGVACVATGDVHAHVDRGRSCRTPSWPCATISPWKPRSLSGAGTTAT